MKRIRWKAVALLALGSLGLAGPGIAREPPTAAVLTVDPQPAARETFEENVVSLRGESLPVGTRLASITEMLVRMIRSKDVIVPVILKDTGMADLDPATVEMLAAFYGDFLERQQERAERLFAETKGPFSEEIDDSFVFERAEFLGGILGRWLALVREEGYDAGRLLQYMLERVSQMDSYSGEAPSYERIEKEGRLFEEAFAQEFGAPLRGLLGRPKEIKK